MGKTKIEYIIEFRNLAKSQYSRGTTVFQNKQIALDIAKSHKKGCPELQVRVVEQTRRILKVL